MRIPKSVLTTGLLLFISTIFLFLVVNFFFKDGSYFQVYDFQYYKTTLIANCFFLPIIYTFGVFKMLFKTNEDSKKDFLVNFRHSFMAMFIGGFLSITFIAFYLNHYDLDALETLRTEQVEMLLSFGPTEQDVIEMKEKLNFDEIRKTNSFSVKKFYSVYTPVLIVFYLLVSFLFGTFFKR